MTPPHSRSQSQSRSQSGSAAPVRVKVCGVTTPAGRDCAVRAGADAVGVVCGVPDRVDTHRAVSPDRARALFAGVPPFVTATLVTVADTPDRVVDLVAQTAPDAVQVHGPAATPDGIATLLEAVPSGTRVIAAADADAGTDADPDADPDADADTGVDASGDHDDLTALARVADAVHLDSHDDTGAGGTGRTHDWARARDLVERLPAPVVLAGGLTPENVTAAVRTVAPHAVDAASGTEGADGHKAPDRVRAFVAGARAATTIPASDEDAAAMSTPDEPGGDR